MGSSSDAADRKLAIAALDKRRRGVKPSREEAAALRRYEAACEDAARLRHYGAIPKKLWRLWSGRQDKVILEQADRYGFPMLRGMSIDLPAFVKRFYDWLAEKAVILSRSDSSGTAGGTTSPAMERKRQLECERLSLLLERDRGLWIQRRVIHEGHARLGGLLRSAGEALLSQFGPAAQKILNDALDNCEREVDRLLAAADDDNGDESGPS